MGSYEDDLNLVSEAAGILEVSDFDIFRLGYYHWFQKQEDFSALENLFGKFITNRADCPFWARDYARKIIDAFNNDQGALKELITLRRERDE